LKILDKLKPGFWDHKDPASEPYKHLFNFRSIWQRAVLVTAAVAIVPLIVTALISYELNRDTMESELMLRTSRLVSNSWRSVSLFLSERRAALDFIAHDNTFASLTNPDRLRAILENLKNQFGGFTDLGILDNAGIQLAYVGPHRLENKDYSSQPWFDGIIEHSVYVSDLLTGFRNEPHIDLAVKREMQDGTFFVLRAALESEKLNELTAQVDVGEKGEAFIINHEGILQTPSRDYGKVLEKIDLPIPQPSSKTRVLESKKLKDKNRVIGYTYIPETPFILMIVKHRGEFQQPWYKTSYAFTGFLVTSMLLILLATLTVTTCLVDQMHEADQERLRTLHQVEYANKMASLGSLAAGIAHEINNPLAIINEKAGHIRDIFTLTEKYAKDQKLIGLVDSILSTVHRSGKVTKRLLNFAGHLNLSIQTLDLREIINEVSSVLAQEAEHRCISVRTVVADDIPQFENDRGKLEQIILNLFNYSFSSMKGGGWLEVTAECKQSDSVSITVADNSRGIPPEDLKHVFEPFFYTSSGESGTGLSLAITYALVKEIGGDIDVQSQVGRGTRFTIQLPLIIPKKETRNL
jgi:two-component system NtrC family sensor kinase